MTIGLFVAVVIIGLAVVYPKLVARLNEIKRVEVAADASIQSQLRWPTIMPAHSTARSRKLEKPQAPVVDDAVALTAARQGLVNALAAVFAMRAVSTLPDPVEELGDSRVSDGVVAVTTVVAEDVATDMPPGIETKPTEPGVQQRMMLFLKRLFGIREKDAIGPLLPGETGQLPDLLTAANDALRESGDAIGAIAAEPAKAEASGDVLGSIMVDAQSSGSESGGEAHNETRTEIDDDTDLGANPPATVAKTLPDPDALIKAAMPATHTVAAQDIVTVMDAHIPDSLGLSDEEMAAFEEEEQARKAQEDQITAEYASASKDAELRASIVADEAAAAERDKQYAKWASEFVGDPDAYVDVDTRGRIIEDLLTFGEDGRTVLSRVVEEDPVYAERARELLAQAA